ASSPSRYLHYPMAISTHASLTYTSPRSYVTQLRLRLEDAIQAHDSEPGPPDETAALVCHKTETLRGTARYHNALSSNAFLDWHSLCYHHAEAWCATLLYQAKAHRHRRTGRARGLPVLRRSRTWPIR